MYRQHDPGDWLRIFEIHHSVSQARKRERLARLGVAEPESATYAPVDFETEPFDARLVDSGFEPALPSVVAWLGGTYYLTPAAIDDTLERVARCAPQTTIIFDYPLPERLLDSFGPPFDGNQARTISRIAEASGEPLISAFTSGDVEVLVRSHGYREVEHLDHAAIRARYMGGQTTPTPGPVPFLAIVRARV